MLLLVGTVSCSLIQDIYVCMQSAGKMNHQGKRRGEDGLAAVIDFLLANARLVLGVGGAAVLGIATLAVKRVSKPE